jgi:hypothetical protein
MTNVGFMDMIQNKATIITAKEPTITNSKRGAADLEFNKQHDHCFFFA